MMTELLFQVEEDAEGGFIAKAVGPAIFTQAQTLEELRDRVKDAVLCHFVDPAQRPRLIRLHFSRDEVLSL